MENAGYLDKLTKLLKSDERIVVEGEINKNKAAELARKYDVGLLNLLQSDQTVRDFFFTNTDAGLVFKKDVFLQFLSNKAFLPDSYTAYGNKVGLATDSSSLLLENKEVVLNWPYKDTILEGNQDTEDAKRAEVFFNETLAPDQITRFLDDKVFVNWKRFNKDGEHELDVLNDKDNLIIKGNNLVVLHSLKKRFAKKVKLIFIDPPYNTGNDGFGYNDRFNHSTWLTFMKNRVTVARDLLTDDGSFWIALDDNEFAYMKVLLDEIFGRENFKSTFIWQHRKSSQNDIDVSLSHNYVVCYAKNKTLLKINQLGVDESNFANPDNDSRGPWVADPFDAPNIRPNLTYPIVNPNTGQEYLPPQGRCWRFTKEGYEKALADNRILFGKTGKSKPQYKRFLSEAQEKGKTPFTIWTDIETATNATKELMKMYESKDVFATPKPESLMERIIHLGSNEGDIVLDYHVGSGTTAAVAHKINRQYIGIEQMYYGDNDPMVRLRKVIDGEQTGISKSRAWSGGGDFVYANIKNDANEFRLKVERAKNDQELIDLLDIAKKSSFLSYRVDISKLGSKDQDFRSLSLANKKRVLLELIDNNTLYVNFADIDDKSYGISNQDKKHNRAFYGIE